MFIEPTLSVRNTKTKQQGMFDEHTLLVRKKPKTKNPNFCAF